MNEEKGFESLGKRGQRGPEMQRKVQIVSNRSENSTKFRLRQLWCLFQAFLRGGIHSAAPNPPLVFPGSCCSV